MRLWHRELIPVLPKQQLLGQWRELCCIAALLAVDHTPNHILVNRITDYPPEHFEAFCNLVIQEMKLRGVIIGDGSLHNIQDNVRAWRLYLNEEVPFNYVDKDWGMDLGEPIYGGWHNDRYLKQCLYNLQEKFDCYGIPSDEWDIIFSKFGGML